MPGRTTESVDSGSPLKAPIHVRTQSDNPIICYGKPVETPHELKG